MMVKFMVAYRHMSEFVLLESNNFVHDKFDQVPSPTRFPIICIITCHREFFSSSAILTNLFRTGKNVFLKKKSAKNMSATTKKDTKFIK